MRPEHLREMMVQPAQTDDLEYILGWSDDTLEEVCALEGWAGMWGNKLVGVAGGSPQNPGRHQVWAILALDITRPQLLACHRGVKQWLDLKQKDPDYRRLETTILDGFKAGHRWARMLGFKPEGLMRRYDHLGRDQWLYSRVVDICQSS